jgi:hypothetical protein
VLCYSLSPCSFCFHCYFLFHRYTIAYCDFGHLGHLRTLLLDFSFYPRISVRRPLLHSLLIPLQLSHPLWYTCAPLFSLPHKWVHEHKRGISEKYLRTWSLQTHQMNIRSRLYSSQRCKPILVKVPTRCTYPARQGGPRFPFAESVLSGSEIQSYVHDCIVTVYERQQTHRFRVFFKRHQKLPANQSLPNGMSFRGDIVIMRVGALNQLSVVNMRGRDTVISDYMVKR